MIATNDEKLHSKFGNPSTIHIYKNENGKSILNTRPSNMRSHTKRKYKKYDYYSTASLKAHPHRTAVTKDFTDAQIYEKLVLREDIKIDTGVIRKFRVYKSADDFEVDMINFGDKPMYFNEIIPGKYPQKVRLDLDCSDDNMTEKKMYELMTEIDDALIRYMRVAYSVRISKDDITTTTCSRQSGDKYKYSYHKIITNQRLWNGAEVAWFIGKIKEKISVEAADIIDDKIYRKNGGSVSLRVLGSSKPEDDVPKVIDKHNTGIRTSLKALLITNREGCDRVVQKRHTDDEGNNASRRKFDFDDVSNEDLMHAVSLGKEYTKGNEPSSTAGNEMLFKRLEPSYCHLCERKHDNDNSAVIGVRYVQSQKGGDKDTAEAYFRCFHFVPREENMPRTITFATFDSSKIIRYKQPNGKVPKDYAYKCERREKYIYKTINSNMSQADDTNLLSLAKNECKSNVYDSASMMPLELKDTLFVRANMKLGKTKSLIDYISDNFVDNDNYDEHNEARIVFITFRQTFAAAIKSKFPEFHLYSDSKGLITQPKVIIQVESLYRLDIKLFNRPDLVILDESESILQQFSSPLGNNFNLSWLNFEVMMNKANHIVCMDAFMSDRTYNIVNAMRPGKDEYLHYNTCKNAKDYKYYITVAQSTWLASLEEDIKASKKVVIVSSSKTEASNVSLLIAKKFNGKYKVGYYSSATKSDIKKQHFGDVNNYWKEYDVLIYTPTVTAGVSFEEHHYDSMYSWFTDKSCDARICMQMMGRIRNLEDKKIVIGVQSSQASLPTTKDEIIGRLKRQRSALYAKQDIGKLEIAYDDNYDIKFKENNYFKLFIENTIIDNKSKNAFLIQLISLIRKTGAKIDVLKEFMTEAQCKEIKKYHNNIKTEIKNIECAEIVGAPDMTKTMFDKIKHKLNKDEELTSDEKLSLDKHKFRTKFNWDHDISTEFYKEYNKPVVVRHYTNSRKICVENNMYDSLKYIQGRERDNHDENVKKSANENGCYYIYSDVKKYISYSSHKAAVDLLDSIGFSNITDNKTEVSGEHLIDKMGSGTNLFELSKLFCEDNPSLTKPIRSKYLKDMYPDYDDNPDKFDVQIIKNINKILEFMYGIKVTKCARDKRKKVQLSSYYLARNAKFEYDESKKGSTSRPHILAPEYSID